MSKAKYIVILGVVLFLVAMIVPYSHTDKAVTISGSMLTTLGFGKIDVALDSKDALASNPEITQSLKAEAERAIAKNIESTRVFLVIYTVPALLAGLFALIAIKRKRFSRGLAIGSTIFGLMCVGLAVLATQASNRSDPTFTAMLKSSSFLFVGGSAVMVIAALYTAIRPEPKLLA